MTQLVTHRCQGNPEAGGCTATVPASNPVYVISLQVCPRSLLSHRRSGSPTVLKF